MLKLKPKAKGIEHLHEKWDYQSFSKGAQLRVKRPFYYHHGIFTGDSVIHFGEGNSDLDLNNPDENKVTECTLQEFLKGGMPEVRIYSKKERKYLLPADEIVSNARKLIGTDGYDFYSNNCEHFSNLCAFGKAYCKQTQNIPAELKK